MRDQDKRAFGALLGDVMAFYRQDVSSFAAQVWWQACAPFELEQVRKALTAHAMDPDRGQYPPKPADIVRQLQGTSVDRSLTAWGKVLDACGRVGAYQSVAFDDPAIHLAIEDLGGWPALCRTPGEKLSYAQHRFCEAHRAYSGRQGQQWPPYLIGEHEAQNRVAGHRSLPPVLIGDASKAAEVMRLGMGRGTQITSSPMLGAADALRLPA